MQMSYHERRSQGRKKGLFLFKFSSVELHGHALLVTRLDYLMHQRTPEKKKGDTADPSSSQLAYLS